MKSTLLISIVVALFLFVPDTAHSCACCSGQNMLFDDEMSSLSDANGASLEGKMGMYIYGGKGLPDIEIGKGLKITGSVATDRITLTLRRNGRYIGILTLKPKGKPIHRMIGLDFILPPESLRKLEVGAEVPIYHEILVNVIVKANRELRNTLGVSFSSDGILIFHGKSNNCWIPSQYGGQWSFRYSVFKNSVTEEGLARGTIITGVRLRNPTKER